MVTQTSQPHLQSQEEGTAQDMTEMYLRRPVKRQKPDMSSKKVRDSDANCGCAAEMCGKCAGLCGRAGQAGRANTDRTSSFKSSAAGGYTPVLKWNPGFHSRLTMQTAASTAQLVHHISPSELYMSILLRPLVVNKKKSIIQGFFARQAKGLPRTW